MGLAQHGLRVFAGLVMVGHYRAHHILGEFPGKTLQGLLFFRQLKRNGHQATPMQKRV